MMLAPPRLSHAPWKIGTLDFHRVPRPGTSAPRLPHESHTSRTSPPRDRAQHALAPPRQLLPRACSHDESLGRLQQWGTDNACYDNRGTRRVTRRMDRTAQQLRRMWFAVLCQKVVGMRECALLRL